MATQSTIKSTNGSDLNAAIALRAYFKAEQRGFAPGYELEDWLSAEQEVLAGATGDAASRPRRNVSSRAVTSAAKETAKPRTKARPPAKS